MLKDEDIKVGVEVEFELEYDSDYPRYDGGRLGEPSGKWGSGKIHSIEHFGEFIVKYNRDSLWYFPLPSQTKKHNLSPYLRLKLNANSKTENDKPIYPYVEVVNHTPSHEIPYYTRDAVIERGNIAVRRRLREWPYGKRLVHDKIPVEDGTEFRFYFVEAD